MTTPADKEELKLLPCPFCGNADCYIGGWKLTADFSVGCEKCHANIYPDCGTFDTPQKAAAAWNTRATDSEIAALREENNKLKAAQPEVLAHGFITPREMAGAELTVLIPAKEWTNQRIPVQIIRKAREGE